MRVKAFTTVQSVAAGALLTLVLMASLTGAVCEAGCIQHVSSHVCCPMSGLMNQHGHAVSVPSCNHPVHWLSASVVAPSGVVISFVALAPSEQPSLNAVSEAPSVLATASPPKFHLRI